MSAQMKHNPRNSLMTAVTGMALIAVSLVTTAGSSHNENHPSYWEGNGYGTCVKYEDPGTPYTLGDPGVGTVWSVIVVKAGSESSVDEPHYVVVNPEPGEYSHPSGKDISHVIVCSTPAETTTTTVPEGTTTSAAEETTSTVPEDTTTTAPQETTTTAPQETTTTAGPEGTTTSAAEETTSTVPEDTTTTAPQDTTTTAPQETTTTAADEPMTTVPEETTTTAPVVTGSGQNGPTTGVLLQPKAGPRSLATTGTTISTLLLAAGAALVTGAAAWAAAHRRHRRAGTAS